MCQDWSAWRPRSSGSKVAALRAFVLTSNNWPCDCETDCSQIAGVQLFGRSDVGTGAAVVSIAIEGYDPQEVAAVLDSNFGIQVRAGLHCAPRMHRSLGTIESGGTVRFSIGAFNTPDEIDAAIAAMAEHCWQRMNRECTQIIMPKTPWFKDGLRFECTQCGDCCTGSPGYVWVNDEEISALAEYCRRIDRRIRSQICSQDR